MSPVGAGAASVLRTLCVELVRELDASACGISRVIGELLILVVEHTSDHRTLLNGQGYFVPDYPLTAKVLSDGQPVALSLTDRDPDPDEAAILAELGYESLAMLCLSVSGRPWALVELYGDGGRCFDAADMRRAAALVAAAETALAPAAA